MDISTSSTLDIKGEMNKIRLHPIGQVRGKLMILKKSRKKNFLKKMTGQRINSIAFTNNLENSQNNIILSQ